MSLHLRAKHVFSNAKANAITSTATQLGSSRVCQTTLAECIQGECHNKATTAKLTNAIAKWITMDCRPINIVEDQGLQGTNQITSGHTSTFRGELLSQEFTNCMAVKRQRKRRNWHKLLRCIALTGDHWTSVSNRNYLGVTSHLINYKWQLALGVVKMDERHFAEACACQFIEFAQEWEIVDKITTVETDSPCNMIATARILPYEHMPRVAHIIQRVITVALCDSGFVDALAKCREIVRHFTDTVQQIPQS